MQKVKKVKGTVALTVVVLLCAVLLSLLSLGPVQAAPGDTVRVSTSSAGVQGNDESGYYDDPSMSPDGRYVAFQSWATNLVDGDTNGQWDIFRKDLTTNQTLLVSTSSSGTQGDNNSSNPSISSDGQYVAFDSDASNLVVGDTNGEDDVFRKDLTTGQTVLVSTSSAGVQGNYGCYKTSMSPDGRYVTFWSYADNLMGVGGDVNGASDIFRKDLSTGQTVLVSTTSSGVQGNGHSGGDTGNDHSSISPDGRYVAFTSGAINLVGGEDLPGTWDIFRKDLETGETLLVSTSSAGAAGDDNSYSPSMSPDGRYVAFESHAPNLVVGDTNDVDDIFRKDLTTGQTVRVSTSSSGTQGNDQSYYPSMSPDGRYVAFESYATDLVDGDTNTFWDIFRKDLSTDQTVLVSTSSAGAQGDTWSGNPSISSDGRYVAFVSWASNLVEGDTNGSRDVFRKDVADLPVPTISSITPTSKIAGQPAFTLTVNGTNFVAGSKVRWNGADRTTTYVSDTQLTASITASDIASPGTANVTAFNPAPGGGTSNTQTFTVNAPPTPAISTISPTSACCGDTLTVNGKYFGSTRGSSYVSFGTKHASSYTSWSNTQIKVKVPSGCYWTRDVKVTTGGGTSNAKTLKIKPHISAISPTSGSVGAYITVGGTGFGSSKSTSSVKFGTKLAYTSSTSWTNVKVKAKVPTLSKGKTTITVTTRGGTSNQYTFTVK